MILRVGTAGWSIPRPMAGAFPGEGTHLTRYARMLSCAEINSSFYRPHAYKTYQKWASLTPDEFRFAVKTPRTITHEQRLRPPYTALKDFMAQVKGLGVKLGVVLVQLPPSLHYESSVAENFFSLLRDMHSGAVVCEPRQASWLDTRANQMFSAYRVTRVIADPPAGGATSFDDDAHLDVNTDINGDVAVYYRLHGAPRMYWSRYSAAQLERLNAHIAKIPRGASAWCVFDNTASGAAIENALELQALNAAR